MKKNIKNQNRRKISKSLSDSITATDPQILKKSNHNHFNTTSNIKQQSINSFQFANISKKTTKNIFKPVYTGYTKNSFGSIPSNTENFLIHTDKNINPRFNDVKSIFNFENNPGVGKYNLRNKWAKHGWSFSKNGINQRFKKPKVSMYPGIGDYNIEEDKKLEFKRNNIRYKSLFKFPINKKMRNYFDKKENGPSSTSYNIVYQDDIIKLKKNYNFDSFIGRDDYTGYDLPFNCKNDYPGPGYYFQTVVDFNNENIKKKLNINDTNTIETEGNINNKNREKLVKKYCNIPDLPTFKLKSRSPKTNDIKFYSTLEAQKQHNIQKLKEKNDKISALDKLLKNKPDQIRSSSNLQFKINQEKELSYIKSVLGNDNGRRDLFYLSCPRWKENKYQLRTPGPAYYFNDNLP